MARVGEPPTKPPSSPRTSTLPTMPLPAALPLGPAGTARRAATRNAAFEAATIERPAVQLHGQIADVEADRSRHGPVVRTRSGPCRSRDRRGSMPSLRWRRATASCRSQRSRESTHRRWPSRPPRSLHSSMSMSMSMSMSIVECRCCRRPGRTAQPALEAPSVVGVPFQAAGVARATPACRSTPSAPPLSTCASTISIRSAPISGVFTAPKASGLQRDACRIDLQRRAGRRRLPVDRDVGAEIARQRRHEQAVQIGTRGAERQRVEPDLHARAGGVAAAGEVEPAELLVAAEHAAALEHDRRIEWPGDGLRIEREAAERRARPRAWWSRSRQSSWPARMASAASSSFHGGDAGCRCCR